MVQIEEVPEEAYGSRTFNERESDFETESNDSFDAEDDDFTPDETIYERVVALKDIIPPQTRSALAVSLSKGRSWVEWGFGHAGNIAWIISTSALLVGLPLALAIEDETRITQQEREMQMQSQGQQQLLGAPPAQQGSGLVPPGF